MKIFQESTLLSSELHLKQSIQTFRNNTSSDLKKYWKKNEQQIKKTKRQTHNDLNNPKSDKT